MLYARENNKGVYDDITDHLNIVMMTNLEHVMLKRRSSKFLGLLATLALAIVLSACGNSGSSSGSSDDSQTSLGNKEIEIPYIASDNSTHVHLQQLLKGCTNQQRYPTQPDESDSFHATYYWIKVTISSKVN